MEIKLILTVEDVRNLLTALSNFPYKDAAPLIQKIEAQGNAQLQAVEAPAAEPAAAEEAKAEKPKARK